MKTFHALLSLGSLLITLCACTHSIAQSDKAEISNLDSFQWQNRIILIRNQAGCSAQHEALIRHNAGVDERHIIWFMLCDLEFTTNYHGIIADSFSDEIQNQYFVDKQDMVVLIGKDGYVKYRSKTLDLNEIYQRIDAMPMRQSEMREQNELMN